MKVQLLGYHSALFSHSTYDAKRPSDQVSGTQDHPSFGSAYTQSLQAVKGRAFTVPKSALIKILSGNTHVSVT